MIAKSVKIGKFAEVISGYTFRTGVETSRNGTHYLVQAKDLHDGTIILEKSLEKIDIDSKNISAELKENDVIFSSRGFFKAAYISFNEPAIASSSVFVIRVKDKNIFNKYIALYLNSPKIQFEISKQSFGSSIKLLKKSDVENLEIQIPELKTQKLIVDLYENIEKQNQLLIESVKINDQIVAGIIPNLLN